jgi:hypothetical protein
MMALEPFPGFRAFPTHHCVTGSMRHVYDLHGVDVSEELLLGLGAGVGFLYWHQKGAPPMLLGRANVGRPGEEGMECAAGRRTGVTVQAHTTSSARTAETALVAQLEAGEPAMLKVDMAYLPYLDLPEGYHFGGHVVAVVGYEPTDRMVLVCDRDVALHPVPVEALAKARGSTFKPFPPRHGWYTFDFRDSHRPAADEVQAAICEAAIGMLEPPIANFGVRGIRKAATLVPRWPASIGAAALRGACINAFFLIDAAGGTGGGLFRYMYGRFLEEAAAITGDPALRGLGVELHAIGDRWQEVAELLQKAAQGPAPAEPLAEAGQTLEEIAGREEAVWRALLSRREAGRR